MNTFDSWNVFLCGAGGRKRHRFKPLFQTVRFKTFSSENLNPHFNNKNDSLCLNVLEINYRRSSWI